MSSLSEAVPSSIGGLSHLMEAATALSRLGEALGPPQSPESPSKPSKAAAAPERCVISDDDEAATTSKSASRKEIFPERLMSILSDSTLSETISWLPHGRSFVVLRPDVFAEQVLPMYFASESSSRGGKGSTPKYPSFTRKLNRWGFRQSTRGPDTGAFHHPLFRRDEAELCLDMVCQKSRKSSKIKKENKHSPLPCLSPKQLPLKKRLKTDHTMSNAATAAEVSDSSSSSDDSSMSAQQTETPGTPSPPQTDSLSIISADSRSESPASTISTSNTTLASSTSTLLSKLQQTQQLLQASLTTTTACPSVPSLPSDPAVVQSALRTQAEMERLRVSKIMLYHAFVQAASSKPPS